MKTLFIILISSLTLVSSFAQKEETLSISFDKTYLEGTLLLADSNVTTPVAFIIAGSGPTDRDGNNPMGKNNSLKMIAQGLAEYGISSLRCDKRGIGKSSVEGLKESETLFDDMVSDAKMWIQLLKKDPRFESVYVLGHSEGSLIGMLSSQTEKIDKYVSLASPGEPAADILKKQIYAQSPMLQAQLDPMFKSLENGELLDSVPEYLQSIFRESVQPYLISWFRFDPREEIQKLSIPILLVNGTTDIQVSVKDAENLKNAQVNAELLIIEGMNHIFKPAPEDFADNFATYTDPDLAIMKEMIEGLASFLLD